MTETPKPRPRVHQAFATTRWSLVLAAGGAGSNDARQALEALIGAYWHPLYAFARRSGRSTDDAADLVQGFFARVCERSDLRGARRDLGRFRSYLLAAFKNYLINQHAAATAARRGGGTTIPELDAEQAESRYLAEPRTEANPHEVFERRWALTVIDRALARLRREYAGAGKLETFDTLKDRLTDHSRGGAYREAAERLGLEEGATRVAAHRLRKRFAAVLRSEVAQTVGEESEVDAELRYLLSALG